MKKKMILAGFACLLLFLVSVAKSDPHRPQPQKPVVAAAPPNTAADPATSNQVRPKKGHDRSRRKLTHQAANSPRNIEK